MNCKQIIIRPKRSKSSFHPQQRHDPSFTPFPSPNQPPNPKPWQNSLISLSKVLTNLNDDSIKKYSSEVNQYENSSGLANHNTQMKDRRLYSQNKLKYLRMQTQFQSLEPEPWFNECEIGRKEKKARKMHNESKSFHIIRPSDIQLKHHTHFHQSTHPIHFNHQSSLNVTTTDQYPPLSSSQFSQQRSRRLTSTLQQNHKLLTQNFTYTNQQKAKVSLQYLLHEKKHKKMQKILKYKAHFIDKTGFKQEKINQHSKYLVEMLKKLEGENVKENNTGGVEVGEVRKKKNSFVVKGNIKLNSFEDGKMQKKEVTCEEVESECDIEKAEAIVLRKKSKPRCSVKRIEPQFDTQFNPSESYRASSLRPKRSGIYDKTNKKHSSFSQKNLKSTENRLNFVRKQQSYKHLSISNHFLNIRKVKA